MRKFVILLGMVIAVFGVGLHSASATAGERLVVDTVAAVRTVVGRIDSLNAAPQHNVKQLEENVQGIEHKIVTSNEKLKNLVEIQTLFLQFGPKIKNVEVRNQIFQFLDSMLSVIPDDSVMLYCDTKDVEKAKRSHNREEAVKRLKDKVVDKLLKEARKGNYTSGMAMDCVDRMVLTANVESDMLNSELVTAQSEVESEKAKIIKKPQLFSADVWYTYMGDADVPTKWVAEAKDGWDADGMSFKRLVEKHYTSKPYPKGDDFLPANNGLTSQRDEFEKEASVTGKYNGLIMDTIGVFPANVTEQNYWQWPSGERERGRFEVFDRVLVVSENGTVPAFEFPLGFKTWTSEWGVPFVVRRIKSYWDKSGRIKDGISIFVNYPESEWGATTLMYNDGKMWKITLPDDAEFLTYDESLKRIRKSGKTPQVLELAGSWFDYALGDGGKYHHTFLVVTNSLIGHAGDADTKVVLKYQNDGKGTSVPEGYCTIKVPGFQKIYVEKNYCNGEYIGDVIIAEGYDETPKKYIYRLCFSEIEDENSFNGRDFGGNREVVLIAEGTYNSSTGQYDIEEVPQGI